MAMGRNGGVRQHRDENTSGGCKCNPLALQKWLQIFEEVVSTFCVQMVAQHRDLGRQVMISHERRGGQTFGIP